jgi:hypothetical protein
MTLCSGVARHKGHGRQGHGKDEAVPSSQKGWAFGKRRQAKLEGIYGIRIKDLKKQYI